LIEWESNLTAVKNRNVALKEAEAKLSCKEFNDYTSPASIVLFASLYNFLSGEKTSDYPALERFFIGFLGTETAKKGIELATAHTKKQKVNASTVAGTSNSTAKPTAPGTQHIRAGIFANKLDGKKMYFCPSNPL
jgi:hypothetical protein